MRNVQDNGIEIVLHAYLQQDVNIRYQLVDFIRTENIWCRADDCHSS